MFSERKLIRLSLFTIIFGLTGLYLISAFVDPEFVELSSIDGNLIGKVISTEGTISKVGFIEKSKTVFLDISENEKIMTVVIFNSEGNLFKKGDLVKITGEVSNYKGKLEITAREVDKI